MIRKIKKEEYQKVIEFANEQCEIDFRKVQPTIYSIDENYKYHYIYQIGDEIIGTFLAKTLVYKNVKMLGIGTLCVRKDKRNSNIMQEMFAYISENLEKDCDIIYLIGDKKRYERLGYYKVGIIGTLKIKNKYLSCNTDEVEIKELTDISDKEFEIISKYDPVCRNKYDAIKIYKGSSKQNIIYLLTQKDKRSIVIFDQLKFEIVEMFGEISSEEMIKTIMLKNNSEYVNVNSDFSTLKTMYEYCDKYTMSNRVSLKIINYSNIIRKLFSYKGNRFGSLKFELKDETILINYSNNGLEVITKKEKNEKYISEREIINILFGNIYSIDYIESNMNLIVLWFPLCIPSTLVSIDRV